jgi:hypothetical protein
VLVERGKLGMPGLKDPSKRSAEDLRTPVFILAGQGNMGLGSLEQPGRSSRELSIQEVAVCGSQAPSFSKRTLVTYLEIVELHTPRFYHR